MCVCVPAHDVIIPPGRASAIVRRHELSRTRLMTAIKMRIASDRRGRQPSPRRPTLAGRIAARRPPLFAGFFPRPTRLFHAYVRHTVADAVRVSALVSPGRRLLRARATDSPYYCFIFRSELGRRVMGRCTTANAKIAFPGPPQRFRGKLRCKTRKPRTAIVFRTPCRSAPSPLVSGIFLHPVLSRSRTRTRFATTRHATVAVTEARGSSRPIAKSILSRNHFFSPPRLLYTKNRHDISLQIGY